MSESETENDLDFGNLSDEELQEAFAAGLLKPGLNVAVPVKEFKNNVAGLKLKQKELARKDLPWIERLDLVVNPAPLAPELHYEQEKSKIVQLKNIKQYSSSVVSSTGEVLDDFKREMLFYRQAQSAVVEGIQKLKQLDVPTKRPDDYFAQMAKSDVHMHKVRENLAARQAGQLKSEKMKELRRLKKMGKQTQIENKLKQQKDKKKMLDEIKKFRKGKRKDLDFLDKKRLPESANNRSLMKKKYKDSKYGFGGKKRGSKANTRESTSDFTSFKSKGKQGNKMNKNIKRPGKSKRIKKRAMKKK